jgi:2-dehydro-3-deoxygluconokinase
MTDSVVGPVAGTAPALVAFGELMLRLDPMAGDRLVQAGGFEARYTGAEANVAASLAGWGLDAHLVSAVPDHALGDACLAYLRRFGVSTSAVLRRPGRLGLLFHEPGGAGRSPVVLYDRGRSVFAECDPAAYDWEALLGGRSWLHLSGTALALSDRTRAAVSEAVGAARRLGLGVSLDLNYRAALWGPAEAGEAIGALLPDVDLLLGSGADAAAVFGLEPPDPWGPGVVRSQVRLAERLRARFGVRGVAGTVRVSAPDGAAALHGLLVDDAGAHLSAWHRILDPTGRIGTGDAFAAGLLRGFLLGHPPAPTVEFAAAAAHLKQSVRGDVNVVTVDEVEAVVAGATTDRVRR